MIYFIDIKFIFQLKIYPTHSFVLIMIFLQSNIFEEIDIYNF